MNKRYTTEERSRLLRKPWGRADVLRERAIQDKLADNKANIEAYKAKLDAEYQNGPFRPVKLTPAQKAEAKAISDKALANVTVGEMVESGLFKRPSSAQAPERSVSLETLKKTVNNLTPTPATREARKGFDRAYRQRAMEADKAPDANLTPTQRTWKARRKRWASWKETQHGNYHYRQPDALNRAEWDAAHDNS